MRTAIGLLIVVAVINGACASDTGEATTSTETLPPAEVTSTTAFETSTTLPPTPTDICPVGLVWEPGTTYVAECFLFPVSFLPSEPGWRSSGAAEQWVSLRWVGSASRLEVGVAMLVLRHDLKPGDIVDEVETLEGIDFVAEPQPTTVGGRTGLVVAIEASSSGNVPSEARSCLPAGVAEFLEEAGGRGLIEGVSRSLLGVGYCHVVRVWVLDIGGRTVTIVAGASDPARGDEAAATVERLLNTASFPGTS